MRLQAFLNGDYFFKFLYKKAEKYHPALSVIYKKPARDGVEDRNKISLDMATKYSILVTDKHNG